MKSKTLACITTMTLFVALAVPLQLTAQHGRYKLIDLGTLGGPNSATNGGPPSMINNIWGPVIRADFRYKGQVIDLGTFGGNNSLANEVNSRGQVVGGAGIQIRIPGISAALWASPRQLLGVALYGKTECCAIWAPWVGRTPLR